MAFWDLDRVLLETKWQRERSGRTQADVAAEMGVKQSWVSDIETGKSDPKLSTLQRYCRAVWGEPLKVRVVRTIRVPIDPQPKRVDFCISA